MDENKSQSIQLYYKRFQLFPVTVTVEQVGEHIHYSVSQNGNQFNIFMNENLEWCEVGHGITERSLGIGHALEQHFM